jgi:hypothetical protein
MITRTIRLLLWPERLSRPSEIHSVE